MFRWEALAGPYAAALGTELPADASPCTLVIARDSLLRMRDPAIDFPCLAGLAPPMAEALLAPFYLDGTAVGAVWVAHHDRGRRFDAEDARRLERLSRFASIGYRLQRAIDTLRDAETHVRNVIELSPQVPWTADADGRITDFNDRWLTLTGLTREQALGDGWVRAPHPDDLPAMQAAWARAVATGSRYDVEHRIMTADGSYRWMRSTAQPYRDASGAVVRWYGATEDIDARRRAELQRADSEARARSQLAELELVYRSAPVGMCVLDRELRYVRINERLAEINGIPARAHLGRTVRELLPDIADLAEATAKQVLATGEAVRDVEFVGTTPARPGVVRTWIEQWMPLKDAAGSTIGVHVVAEEVTEQRRAADERERLLEEIERGSRELRQTLDTAAIGLTRLDRGLRYVSANAAYARIAGLPLDRIVGRTLHEVLGAAAVARVRPYIDRVLAGESVEYEAELPWAASGPGWIHARYTPWLEPDGTVGGWVASIEDISARKRTDEQRRLAEARLQLATESARIATWEIDYVAGVGHWTPQAAALWGVEPGTCSIDAWVDALHPDDRTPAAAAWQRAVEERAPYEIEYRSRVPAEDGGERWFLSRGVVERDAVGAPIRALGVFVDISSQKRAAAALAAREAEFRALADNISQFAWMADGAGSIYWYNRRWFEYTGTTLEQMRGWGWHAVHHPDHVARVVEKIAQCFASGEPWEDTFPLRGRDGEYRWFLSRALPIRDESGAVVRWFGTNTDITADREREQALRDSEARFRAIQEASIDGFMLLDSVRDATGTIIDFRWRYANAAAERIVGKPPGWFAGRRLLEEMPGNRDEGLFDGYVRVVESREPWTHEFAYRHDGVEAFLRLVATPVGDGFATVFADLTERSRAAASIAERERRFSALANAMPQLVFANHPNGDPEFLSDQWAVFTGRSLGELMKNDDDGWHLAVYPDDVRPTQARWAASLASGAPYEAEFRLRRHDGVYCWFLVRATAQRAPDGSIERWIGTCTDIDAAKRFEQRLRQSEQRFAALANSVPVLVWTTDADGANDFVSTQWTAYTGQGAERARGDGWLDVLHPDDMARTAAAWRDAVRAVAPYEIDYRLRDRDGIYRWFKGRGVPDRDAEGRIVRWIGTCTDIDAAKITEQLLRDQEDALREADRRKDVFLATLSHELRNPLAPIRTAAQLLTRPGLDAKQTLWAQTVIQRQVKHMAWLLDDLLDVSRITQGKLTLKRERVAIATVVDSAVEAARPLIDRKNHQLTVTLPPAPVYLDADPLRLSQVLSNLLTNAAKYTDPGGHIELTVRVESAIVTVAVKDTGIGVPPDALHRLFEMFAQVQGEHERADGGLGIGLALVKGLVELHGGAVEAASDGVGLGSTFTVRLPCAVAAFEGGATLEGCAPPLAPKGRKVLIVDDNRDAADGLAMLLRLAGHEIRVAYEGRAALSLAQAFRPDVALLDIGMPGMNGYELARAFRLEPWGQTPTLVALTGWGQDEDRRRAAEAGFDRHLTKPVDPAQIEALLDSGAADPSAVGESGLGRTTPGRRS